MGTYTKCHQIVETEKKLTKNVRPQLAQLLTATIIQNIPNMTNTTLFNVLLQFSGQNHALRVTGMFQP